MVLLVKIFSIAVIVYGCLLIFRPETPKKLLELLKERKNFYIASAVKAVIGVILMLAAGSCAVPWIIMFFGAISLFSGVLVFVIKKSLITELFDWIEKQPPRFVYYIGIMALLVGVIMALAA
jgi:MFS family permease